MSIAQVLQSLGQSLGPAFGAIDMDSVRAIDGGSINQCYVVATHAGERAFLKLNDAAVVDMFQSESEGLLALAQAAAVRVPVPLATGVVGDTAYLLMEYLEFGGKTAGAARELGLRLARQHRHAAPAFGWQRDNAIGSTRQANQRGDNWIDFWRDARLGFQLRLAVENGLSTKIVRNAETLLKRIPDFFDGYAPVPSLLHGDLWGGNWAVMPDGEPVIFDPAVYFGDRETDIAMTMLFGGFSPEFLSAYESEWSLNSGFRRRIDLYNLYHVLNHFNLFGGGYQQQADAMLNRLLD